MWINAKNIKPSEPQLVEVKTAIERCRCGGHVVRECYYDGNIFLGIVNQSLVDFWRPSPKNDLLDDEIKRSICATDCGNCVEV